MEVKISGDDDQKIVGRVESISRDKVELCSSL